MAVRALRHYPALTEDDNVRHVPDEVEAVRDEDARAVGNGPVDALAQDVLCHVRVHRRERVIEHEESRVRVHGTRDADALLLPTGQVDAALADLGAIACRQRGDIGLQPGHRQCALVPLADKRQADDDVFAERRIKDPCLLRHIPDPPLRHAHAPGGHFELGQQSGDKRALAAAHRAYQRHQPARGHLKRNFVQNVSVRRPAQAQRVDRNALVVRLPVHRASVHDGGQLEERFQAGQGDAEGNG